MYMLSQVIRRQFAPLVSMLRQTIDACPDDAFTENTIGPREHIYHALVGMDIWLSADPAQYAFDGIVDKAAAQLDGPASDRVSREFLTDCLAKAERKVEDLPDDSESFLSIQELRGTEFTLLDRCLSQLRHVQHHIGVTNEIFRSMGKPTVGWSGYGE